MAVATSAVERLLDRMRVLATGAGRSVTAIPALSFFRADAPIAHVRGYSQVLNLAVATSGRKLVRLGSRVEANDAEHFLVMHGGKRYEASVEANAANPYIALKLQLPPAIVGRSLLKLAESGRLQTRSFESPPMAFVGRVEDRLADALCRLLDCLGDDAEQQIVAPLILEEVTFHLLRSPAASLLRASITREHLHVFQATRFIEAHAERPLTVQEIAGAVAMSPSLFARRFHALVGTPPIQYLKMVRLSKARLLLLDQNLTVDSVAAVVGYASVSHFSRDFKRQFGLSPARYPDAFRQAPLIGIDN